MINVKKLLVAATCLLSLNLVHAADPINYRLPMGVPKNLAKAAQGLVDDDFMSFKCRDKKDSPVVIKKRLVSNGVVEYALDSPFSTGDYIGSGKFKQGVPDPNSMEQKVINEYQGPIPGFVCAKI